MFWWWPVLDGVRVVDLSTDVAGGYGTKLLAAFGADVVKVEGADGDPTRQYGQVGAGPDSSVLFAYLNTGKRSAQLDARDTRGRQQLLRLLRSADAIVESGMPGAWTAMGVDFEALIRERPDLVVCSVTPYGQDGPNAGWRATSLTSFASGGQMYLCGEPDQPPLKVAGHQAYYQGGLHVFASVMTLLYAARKTGVGEHLDISLQEVQASSLEGAGPAALTRSVEGSRAGNRARATWGVYPCAGGFVGVASMARQVTSVLQCIGQEQLVPAASAAIRDELNELLETLITEWVSARTAEEVYEESERHRAPFSLIPTPRDLIEWPPLKRSGFWTEVDHPVLGRHLLPAAPCSFGGNRGEQRRAPLLGEHTDEVIGKLSTRPSPVQPVEQPDVGVMPLSGVRVLDLTQVWAGPFGTRFLGDMGADVIHIEGPSFPDAVRAITNPELDRAYDRSAYFNEYNRNKRSLVLDLQRPKGLAVFNRLVRDADVVIENWSAGVAARLGVSYGELRKVNPALIMVQMPGFASEGPESTRVGSGPTIEQSGGLVALQGYEGGPPHKSGSSYGDPTAGVAAAGATALALWNRLETGEGAHVVLSQRDNVIGLVGEYILAESIGHPLPTRTGNWDPDSAPHNVYRCRDGEPRPIGGGLGTVVGETREQWLAIAVDSDEAWRGLRSTVDDGRLEDPAYLATAGRLAHREQIDVILGEWTAGQDAHIAAGRLQDAGVAAAPVHSPLTLLSDPHLRDRSFFTDVAHPAVGRHLTTHPVWRLRRRTQPPLGPAPCFGEHNDAVLRDLLGLTPSEVESLSHEGVIARAPVVE